MSNSTNVSKLADQLCEELEKSLTHLLSIAPDYSREVQFAMATELFEPVAAIGNCLRRLVTSHEAIRHAVAGTLADAFIEEGVAMGVALEGREIGGEYDEKMIRLLGNHLHALAVTLSAARATALNDIPYAHVIAMQQLVVHDSSYRGEVIDAVRALINSQILGDPTSVIHQLVLEQQPAIITSI